jgi:hypothetical protein
MITRKLFAPSLVLAGAVALLACARQAPAPARDPGARERTVLVSEPVQPEIVDSMTPLATEPMPEPMFACLTDEDCTVVELGCCDACNGGWQLSVNTKHVDHATQELHESDCGTTACTRMACVDALSPVCDGGLCARREEEPSENGEVRISIIRNVLPPG